MEQVRASETTGRRILKALATAWQWALPVAERCALPAILLLAFALRLYRLGDKNIWWDEGLAIWAVRKGLAGVTAWTAQDVHPPLYFWSLLAWVKLAGETEFAARFISAIWGVLTVAACYPLGKRLGGPRVGLAAALLLAVSRFHVWWSQEMRMYVLATLAATLTLYLAVRWLDEERTRSRWRWPVLYALAATACMYTIYMAGLAPLVANGYALLALRRLPPARRRPAALRWVAAQAAALLLLAPWLAYALGRMHSWSVTQPYSLRALATLYGSLLAAGASENVERYLPLVLPFALTLLGGLATLFWRSKRSEKAGGPAALLLGLAFISMPLVVYILTRPRGLLYTPRVEARYFLLFAPAFAVFLGWSAARLWRRLWPLGLAALVACLAVSGAVLPGYYQGRILRDEMQTMCRILSAKSQPGDTVLLISGDRYPLFYYYYDSIVPPARRAAVLQLPAGERFTAENVERELAAATAGKRRFWVAAIETNIQDPDQLSLRWLDAHFPRVQTLNAGHNALILYGEGDPLLTTPVQGLAPQWPLDYVLGQARVLGFDEPVYEVQPGDVFNLGLYGQAADNIPLNVEWHSADGTLLLKGVAVVPNTGEEATRLNLRFSVWPWYRQGGTYFVLKGGQTLQLPGPRIVPAPDQPAATPAVRLAAPLGEGISLSGYTTQPAAKNGRLALRPGQQLVLDLYWTTDQPMKEDLVVFTHLVGTAHNPKTNGPVWGQHDGPPGAGVYPTHVWPAGVLVPDRHILTLDPAAPAGEYQLEVGLYRPQTGERVGAGRVVVATVTVR